MSFQLSVITPAGKIFEETVDSVAAVGLEGGFEVHTGHACFLSALKAGRIRIRQNGAEKILNTESGILEVQPDHNVLVLVDGAQVPA